MAATLEIMELLHMDTGKIYFEVFINDDWKFPRLGLFKTREKAEEFMKQHKKESGK